MVHVKKKKKNDAQRFFSLRPLCGIPEKKISHRLFPLCNFRVLSFFFLSCMSDRSFFLSFFILGCLRTKDEESSFPPSFKNPTERKRRKPHLANGRPRYDWLCQAQVIYDTKKRRERGGRNAAAKEPLFMQEKEIFFLLQ